MKQYLTASVLVAFLALTAGCSTMYFHNTKSTGKTSTEYGEWHHDGILQLVEFSDPVQISQRCNKSDWDTIKVEKTFVQGFAASFTAGLYDPWEVEYSCQ